MGHVPSPTSLLGSIRLRSRATRSSKHATDQSTWSTMRTRMKSLSMSAWNLALAPQSHSMSSASRQLARRSRSDRILLILKLFLFLKFLRKIKIRKKIPNISNLMNLNLKCFGILNATSGSLILSRASISLILKPQATLNSILTWRSRRVREISILWYLKTVLQILPLKLMLLM